MLGEKQSCYWVRPGGVSKREGFGQLDLPLLSLSNRITKRKLQASKKELLVYENLPVNYDSPMALSINNRS